MSTTVQTTEYNGGTTTTVTTTTTTGGGGNYGGSNEADQSTKTMGIVELAIGAACAVLAIATIIFSWTYLDGRLNASTLTQYNTQCKNELGSAYVGQVCQAVVCGNGKNCPTDTITGDAMYCGVRSTNPVTSATVATCLPCPFKIGSIAVEGKNYIPSTFTTAECTVQNIKNACTTHCSTQSTYNSASVQAACEATCTLTDAQAAANVKFCQGRDFADKNDNQYYSRKSCGGYPWNFDLVQSDPLTYPTDSSGADVDANLLVCGRPMYAAVCYDWGDQYQLTGDTGVQQSTIDTTPLGLLRNYKYGGGIPSTIAASLALVVAIPAIINGLMAMQGNEGGVKATGGLAIGFSVIGFCTSTTCLIIVCVLAGTATLVEYLFAIFNGYQSDSSTCTTTSVCFKSVREQAALSNVISYYFQVLSFMVGFLFAISIIQSIFAVVVCCAFKRKGQA